MVELRVVEAIEEVDRAGAGGGDADADLVGELGMAAGHEGGHLLVPRLDELRVAVGAVERPQESVDPVARIAEQAMYSPFAQAFQDVVGDELGHDAPFRDDASAVPGDAGRKTSALCRRSAATADADTIAPAPRTRRCRLSTAWTLRPRASRSNGPCAPRSPSTGSQRLSGRSAGSRLVASAARRSPCRPRYRSAMPGATLLPDDRLDRRPADHQLAAIVMRRPRRSPRRRPRAGRSAAPAAPCAAAGS